MEERQVTVSGTTHALPALFLVMATQNPIEQKGTYPLPEAQMDRFLLHVLIDYPDEAAEVDIVKLVRSEVHDVLRHRLQLSYEANAQGVHPNKVIDEIVIVMVRSRVGTKRGQSESPRIGARRTTPIAGDRDRPCRTQPRGNGFKLSYQLYPNEISTMLAS